MGDVRDAWRDDFIFYGCCNCVFAPCCLLSAVCLSPGDTGKAPADLRKAGGNLRDWQRREGHGLYGHSGADGAGGADQPAVNRTPEDQGRF